MMIELTAENTPHIKNPVFLQYAQIYSQIYNRFIDQVRAAGMEFDKNLEAETCKKLERIRQKNAHFRNSGKSITTHWISSACEACQKGVDTVTLFISLMCHRKCFFCFNPNQESYEYFLHHKRAYINELEQMFKHGQKFSHIALTGGEPLLHKKEMLEFFQYVQKHSPRTHTRLYTSGDFLDPEILLDLQESGLNEIRFSIKLEDTKAVRKEVYERIALAKKYIPDVMVEMPVIPGTLAEMKELLLELNRLNISGINLLEFCFPYHNAEEFVQRGFKVKNPPFKVLYDYWYAGGLPISRSELEGLDLLEFALDQQLNIGIHYCSLENKQTGQIYQQNYGQSVSNLMYFSPKDYFFKSAKVFGTDIDAVKKVFKKKRINQFQVNSEYQFLEFNPRDIKFLKELDLEIGISSNIMETREDGKYLRELKIDLTSPKDFDLKEDV
ncbi:radical SAM protein [Desulfitobacterium sp. AusDCA]|uniref:radical SAM protein n=1 Tax=Desulfitobacterium sp. AusDCA TaxID=3240383 RepID=UPI003DA6D2B4